MSLLRRSISKRLFENVHRHTPYQMITTIHHSSTPPPHNQSKISTTGFFRRFLQRRAINSHSLLELPLGDNLREKLRSNTSTADQRLRFDGLIPPATNRENSTFGVGVSDVKRILRFVQIEKVRERLRNVPEGTIPFGEFVRICCEVLGNREMGLECANAMDECGNIVVLGGVVFLRPDQVAKSIETLISHSIALPNDPRRKEFDRLHDQKALIDQKAQSLVRGELYFGLGFLVLQTLGFMRLTFWELSWDVMEPICFFVTSAHFALAYVFFLRTSNEPSFEGYFRRRFKVKQEKIMRSVKFDVERYNQLCEAFYPDGYCRGKYAKSVV